MDDDDRGTFINGVSWGSAAGAFIFLALRIYCKLSRRNSLWWDDYFLIASWVCMVTGLSIISRNVYLGVGKHISHVNPDNFSEITLNGFIAGTFAILAAIWSKTSFALTLVRLTRGYMRLILCGVIVTTNLAMISNAVSLFLPCRPFKKAWKPQIPGTCWDIQVTVIWGIIGAAYSGAMDFALALLPWTLIIKLQMKRKEKIGVAVAMSMGVFAGTAAIIKCFKIPCFAREDFTFETGRVVVWGALEAGVSIIGASIPVLRVLLKDMQSYFYHFYMKTKASLGSLGSRNRRQTKPPQVNKDKDNIPLMNLPQRLQIVETHTIDVHYSPRRPSDMRYGVMEPGSLPHGRADSVTADSRI